MLKEISNPHGFLTFSGIGTLLGRGFVRLNGFGSKVDKETSSQVLTITGTLVMVIGLSGVQFSV